jgi:VWFA-related protein
MRDEMFNSYSIVKKSLRRQLLLLSLACAAFGQTPSFHVETRLVEVPVVVRDKRTGQAVGDLKTEDFVLLENGKPRKIEFFSVYRPAASVQASPETARGPEAAPLTFRNRRDGPGEAMPVIAVLIDGYNARFEDQYYAAQAAAKVIESREKRALWSVYFLGKHGIRILHDYSTNTESVVDRLRRLRTAGDSAEGLGAEAGEWRPYTVGDLERKASSGIRNAEEELRIITTLASLREIGRHLNALPGRKSLIWLTAGLSLARIVKKMPHLWHLTLDTLNDANVAVYSIDSEGVRTPRGFRAEIPASRGVSLKSGLRSPMEDTHILASLSEATGGRWFMNSNDLAKGVEESLTDSQVVYRLAFRTSREKWDRATVALKVKVPGRKDLAIRHRLSYLARPSEPLAEKARDRLLADAITCPLEAVEIGVTARLSPVPDSSESLLKLTLDAGSVTLKQDGGRFKGRFDVRCVQAAVDSKVIDDFTDEVTLDLAAADAERTSEEGFHYQRQFRINADAHALKIAFCDHATGRLGSLRVPLTAGSGKRSGTN